MKQLVRQSRLLHFISLILLFCLLAGNARADLFRIDQAILVTDTIERQVNLPHRLSQTDLEPNGSKVIYRLSLDRLIVSDDMLAIYISKVALSARLLLNGQLVWTCAPGDLLERRCLHHPQLIEVPAGILTEGQNTLDFEVFADTRQTNGLGSIIVGSYDEVFAEHYILAWFLKVDLPRALGIFAAVTGLLSIAIGVAASRERVYFLFAAAAAFEALAVFLMLAIDPPGSKAVSSWLIFSIRYVGVLLKLLLLHEVFGQLRLRDPLVACFVLLLVVGPAAIAMTDSSLLVVLGLYSMVGIGMAVTIVRIMRWTFYDPSPRNICWTVTGLIIFLASLHDYLRLGGAAHFDGVYLLYYVFPVSIIVMGSMLFSQVGKGLRVARDFNKLLSEEVAERTSALESALASIKSMESSALSLTRNIPIGTFILQTWSPERAHYAFFSDRLREMMNLPPDSEPPLLIRNNSQLHPEDVDSTCAALHRSYDQSTRFDAEFRIRNAAGDWRWFHCIMLPQPDTRTPVVWDGVVIDVTEAREAEERLRRANAGLVAAAAEQSRVEERERLLREMHDGFGSQLSSARLAIEKGGIEPETIARILLDCSQDLRILVDTFGNADGDLGNAIADFRYRTDRLLFGTELSITWEINIPEQTRISPTVILHVLRVLQEALNNALRHSDATKITFSVHVSDGQLCTSLSDNGRGFQKPVREGRGMANMRKRSREIGAVLSVQDTEQGVTVTVMKELNDAI